jgi:hypothetical protein
MTNKRRQRLSAEEWTALADKFHQVIALLAEIDTQLGKTLTVARMRPFWRAFGRIQDLKSRLDSLAVQQQPSWPDAIKLFYGPRWTYFAYWV